jgi:hypothetical protein
MSFENGPSNTTHTNSDSDRAPDASNYEASEPELDDDSSVEEQQFDNLEKWKRILSDLGGVSLEQTVELQQEEPEAAELSPQENELTDEDGSDYGDYEVENDEDEDEDEDEIPAWLTEDELEEYKEFKKFKKSSPWKMQSHGDENTRNAALEFVYLATGLPVDEIK